MEKLLWIIWLFQKLLALIKLATFPSKISLDVSKVSLIRPFQHHQSETTFIFLPLPTSHLVLAVEISLVLYVLFQMWEEISFLTQCLGFIPHPYLFLINLIQGVLVTVITSQSSLAFIVMLLSQHFLMPTPPLAFGLQTESHLTRWTFLLSSMSPHRKFRCNLSTSLHKYKGNLVVYMK